MASEKYEKILVKVAKIFPKIPMVKNVDKEKPLDRNPVIPHAVTAIIVTGMSGKTRRLAKTPTSEASPIIYRRSGATEI